MSLSSRLALVALVLALAACGRSNLYGARCAPGDTCPAGADAGAAGGGGHAGGGGGGGGGNGGAGGVACAQTAEICGNGKDDNCNGLADCADPGCFGDRACSELGVEICNNGLDDDDDGRIDCADPDCASSRACIPGMGREICDNGSDDNGDRLVDCSDPQCVSFPACLAVACVADVALGVLPAHGGRVGAALDTTQSSRSFATCAPPGGHGMVAEVTLTETTDVQLDFTQAPGAAHVVSLYRAGAGQACDQNLIRCLPIGQASSATSTFPGLTAGVYRVIVQSYPGTEATSSVTLSTGIAGKVEICNNGIDDDSNGLVDCQDAACVTAASCAGSECMPDATVGALVVGASPKTVTVDTTTSSNRFHPPCAGASKGNDRVVAFSLPAPGGVEVVFQQSGDHTFSFYKMPVAGDACDDDANLISCAYLGQSAGDFALDNLAAGKYLLIAKSTGPMTNGRLALQLSAFANRKVETCSNGIDDDGNGLIDCADPACIGVGNCTTTGCSPLVDLGSFAWGTQRSTMVDVAAGRDLYHTSCGRGDGKEQVVRLTITQPMTLGLDCTEMGSQVFQLAQQLNPLDACDANLVNCGDPEVLPFGCSYGIPNLQPGTYNLIVEGFQSGTEGSVELTLTGVQETVREICDNGIDDDKDGATDCADLKCVTEPACQSLACRTTDTVGLLPLDGSAKPIVVQTSMAVDNQRTAACTSAPGGQDAVVNFQLPAAADLTIEWAQAGNHALALYSDGGMFLACDAGTAYACIATMGQATGTQVIQALPAGRYHLVVDADKPGSEGGVVLRLSALAAM